MVKAETGWEVKVEPGLQQIVSGKFRNKPAADAIRLMLGRVRFAFLPRLEEERVCWFMPGTRDRLRNRWRPWSRRRRSMKIRMRL